MCSLRMHCLFFASVLRADDFLEITNFNVKLYYRYNLYKS